MKIIALDTSGLVASVALLQDETLVAEYSVQYKKNHSQTLLPMLDAVREMTELDLGTVDAVAVAAGPGSFTGLRIGSATAKGLALALGCPVIPVPTLEGMAYNLYGTDKLVCPIMDARRGQVYAGIYEFLPDSSETKTPCGERTYHIKEVRGQCAEKIEELAGELNGLNREVIFLGDGTPVFEETLGTLLHIPYSFAPAHCSRQKAGSLAALAREYYKAGRVESAAEHRPEYLRLSQAERERLNRT